MNPRIELILRLARQTLGDKGGDRWSDQDLLDLLDLGHKDYAHHAQILRGFATIPLIPGQTFYELPSDIFTIIRAEWDNCKLRISSYEEMDELARKQVLSSGINNNSSRNGSYPNSDFNSDFIYGCWQEDMGPEPQAIVVDKSNMDEFRLYPILELDNDTTDSYTFSNESGIDLPFVGAELYGLTTAIDDYTFDGVYGVVTDLYDPQIAVESFDHVEGEITDITETQGNLNLRYIKTPDTLTSTQDDLLTPRGFDIGLKYYIVGHALRNDLDQRNVARGNQELEFYQRELANAAKVAELNGARHSDRITAYRNGFI